MDRFIMQEAKPIEGAAKPTPPVYGQPAPVAQEPVKRLSVGLPASLHQRVKIGCVREDVAIAEVIREYLEKRFPDL
ncbi:MAG: hypothetical protein AAF449_25610 [Myxococcota bacterium]